MNFKPISDEYIHQPYGCNSATNGIQYTFWAIGFAALLGMPSLGIAQSSVGSFSSVVTIQGPVTQTATGNQVQQDLNIGSAQKSQANTFSSVVTTGAITQTGQNGAQQIINVGGMNNSKATNFDARVNVGRIEQVGRNGEQQQLDIGSVSNSTVSGTATTRVEVGKGVKQTGNGEIVLGAVKNSNVSQFESNLNVRGKIEGNNIRMGSVVGNVRTDNRGRFAGYEQPGVDNTPQNSFQFPHSFDSSSKTHTDAIDKKNKDGFLQKINNFQNASHSFVVGGFAQAGSLAAIAVDEMLSTPELIPFLDKHGKLVVGSTLSFLFDINETSRQLYASRVESEYQMKLTAMRESNFNPAKYIKAKQYQDYLEKYATVMYENTGNCLFDGSFSCDANLFRKPSDLENVDSSIVRTGNEWINNTKSVVDVTHLASSGVKLVRKSRAKLSKNIDSIDEASDGAVAVGKTDRIESVENNSIDEKNIVTQSDSGAKKIQTSPDNNQIVNDLSKEKKDLLAKSDIDYFKNKVLTDPDRLRARIDKAGTDMDARTDSYINEYATKLNKYVPSDKFVDIGIPNEVGARLLKLTEIIVVKVRNADGKEVITQLKPLLQMRLPKKGATDLIMEGKALGKTSDIASKSGKIEDWYLLPENLKIKYASKENFEKSGGTLYVPAFKPIEINETALADSIKKELPNASNEEIKAKLEVIKDLRKARSKEYEKLMTQFEKEIGFKEKYHIDENTGRIVSASEGPNKGLGFVPDIDGFAFDCTSGDKKCSPAETEAMINHLLKVKLCAQCDGDTKLFQHGAETSIWTKYVSKFENALRRNHQVMSTLNSNENILDIKNGSAAVVNYVRKN